MGAAESGGTNRETEDRDWLLRCEGFRVEGPEGPIGHVVAPIYEPSARWDRPSALAVRTPNGVIVVPIDAVDAVDPGERRITVARRGDAFGPAR